MSTDGIYQKYIHAMQLVTGDGTWVDWGVVRLALRLAVLDAYDAGLETCSGMADDLAAIVASQAQSTAERDRLRLLLEYAEQELEGRRTSGAAWVDEIDRLREQVAAMDADNAGLIAEVARLTRQNVIATDTFNSLVAERANGNGAESPADAPAWWFYLDAETNDWRISLDAGRRTFRQVPKAQRLLLAQAVARHVGGGKLPKRTDFDLGKPDWMPGGGGLAQAFGFNWAELLTVTPFEVAP